MTTLRSHTTPSDPPRRAPARLWEFGAVVAITLVGGALRFMQLDDEGLWLDEAFSIWLARFPLSELFSWVVRIDQHPPLYYVMLHGWLRLGEGEAAVRTLSALLSTATLPLFYFAARRMLGFLPAALAAALLLALSPFHIRFAQEARMYALLTFNVSGALLALACLVTGDHRLRWWVSYVLFTWLALLTHNAAVLFLAAVNLGVALAAWLEKSQTGSGLRLPGWRHWLAAQGATLLLWLPWLQHFLIQARAVDREFWIQQPTVDSVMATWTTFFSAFLPEASSWALAAGLVALALGIVGLWRTRSILALLLTLLLAPMALELLVSMRRPIFYDRTLIWTTLPLYMILGSGLRLARWRGAGAWLSAAAISGLLVGNLLSLRWYYGSFQKEQWREAADWVAESAGADDLLLFNATWVQIPFDYYFARYDRRNPMHGAPVDLFEAGILEPRMTEDALQRVEALVGAHDCVYLIYSHNWYTDPDGLLPRTLGRLLRPLQTLRFVGLEVKQYERIGGAGCAADPQDAQDSES